MSQKRSHPDTHPPPTNNQNTPSIPSYESTPITDRSSKFIAIFSPTIPPSTLQAHPPYKSATHRILAWRKPSKQQSLGSTLSASTSIPTSTSNASTLTKVLYDTGSDDDGEKYAGKKLEKVLVELNVVGSVVVARWYGGVMLGPVRFDHIANVAREAIMKWRGANGSSIDEANTNVAKRLKVEKAEVELTAEQTAEQKARLVKQLVDRDESIVVLRGLLAEKKDVAKEKGGEKARVDALQRSQSKTVVGPDYASMELIKLRQLEKARDTTISWILKQIDQAETSPVNVEATAAS